MNITFKTFLFFAFLLVKTDLENKPLEKQINVLIINKVKSRNSCTFVTVYSEQTQVNYDRQLGDHPLLQRLTCFLLYCWLLGCWMQSWLSNNFQIRTQSCAFLFQLKHLFYHQFVRKWICMSCIIQHSNCINEIKYSWSELVVVFLARYIHSFINKNNFIITLKQLKIFQK